jgi:hypothetical protein
MTLTEIEQERLDNLVLHFVKKKSILSGGANGLGVVELMNVIRNTAESLVEKGLIKKRATITDDSYFI